jgi:hypothetical protein
MRRFALASSLAATLLAACSTNPIGVGPDMAPQPGDMAMQQQGDLAGVTTYSYSLTPFTLQPGQEQINCYYIPADGVEKYFNHIVVDMNPGSHHLIVMRINESSPGFQAPAAGPAPCQDIPSGFDAMLPGSQTQHYDYQTPTGVAMRLGANHGLYFQSHYINATQAALTTAVTWRIDTVDKSAVQQVAGIVFYSNWGVTVPPGMSQAKMTCPAPVNMNLITGLGHMHKRGIAFDTTLKGTNILHTDTWDDPAPAIYAAPGLPVAKGDPIVWTCTYNNMDATTYTFGNSAATNEMCIFAAGYYPSIDGNGATVFNDGSCF